MEYQGLNNPLRKKEIRLFVSRNNLDFVAIVETRVMDNNLDKVSKNTFGDWEFCHNNETNPKGWTQITWNSQKITVMIVEKKNKVFILRLSLQVTLKGENFGKTLTDLKIPLMD